MAPRPIDKMHIVHARRPGRHAGEAGKTAIDMFHGRRIGGPVLFEHILDEIDSSARTIELVAKQHESRAGRVAESAMDAGAENFLRLRRRRILELRERKTRLHLKIPPTCVAAPGYFCTAAYTGDVSNAEPQRNFSSALDPAKAIEGKSRLNCCGVARDYLRNR